MLVNLQPLLSRAQQHRRAVAAFNVFGYGWARELVRAAEEVGEDVILLVNPGMADYLRPRLLAPILLDLAQQVGVRVCLQLDHGKDLARIEEALQAGFSSVMYDGSALPLEENIARSQQVVQMAKTFGATVEGEVGTVRYTDLPGTVSQHTLLDEVARYGRESGVDAVAVSVGSTHRSTVRDAKIDYRLLAAIHQQVRQPLVIHGASGIAKEDLRRMPTYGVHKYNLATLLRMAYGKKLRETLAQQPDIFDKLTIDAEALTAIRPVASELLRWLAVPAGEE